MFGNSFKHLDARFELFLTQSLQQMITDLANGDFCLFKNGQALLGKVYGVRSAVLRRNAALEPTSTDQSVEDTDHCRTLDSD